MDTNQTRQYYQLHIKVENNQIILGNCAHCVARQERPAIARRPEFHPENSLDYNEQELISVDQQLARALARYGVKITSSTFIPKETMPRALE